MAEEPDRIRQEIEATRAELTRDVDRLTDKTSPKQMARRRWTAVKEKVMGAPRSAGPGMHTAAGKMRDTTDKVKDTTGTVTETVTDKATQAKDWAGETAQQAAEKVRQAPTMLAEQTQGNPLAAGLIAFGAGLLAASLIPESELEHRAGQRIKDRAGDIVEPVREPLAESARQIKDDLGPATRDAVEEVKQTARDAASTTRDEVRDSATQTADHTRAVAREANARP